MPIYTPNSVNVRCRLYIERDKNKIQKHINKNLWTALKFEGIQNVVIKTETLIFLVKEINIYFFEMF